MRQNINANVPGKYIIVPTGDIDYLEKLPLCVRENIYNAPLPYSVRDIYNVYKRAVAAGMGDQAFAQRMLSVFEKDVGPGYLTAASPRAKINSTSNFNTRKYQMSEDKNAAKSEQTSQANTPAPEKLAKPEKTAESNLVAKADSTHPAREKIKKLLESFPSDTPGEYVIYGYGGVSLTLDDLASLL